MTEPPTMFERFTGTDEEVFNIGAGEVTRRGFGRAALGVLTGFVVGRVTPRAASEIAEFFADNTEIPTGNAAFAPEVERVVVAEATTEQQKEVVVVKPPEFTADDFTATQIIVGSFWEEFIYRLGPSSVIGHTKNEIDMTLGLSRREAIAGVINAVGFGAYHNITSEGIRTDILPVEQSALGFTWWWVQRRFGFAASGTSHAAHNLTVWRKDRARNRQS